METRQIVITGLGATTAIGANVAAYSEALRAGKDGISRIEAFDTFGGRSCFAGEIKRSFDPRDRNSAGGKPIDRSSALTLEAAREAWQSSALAPTEGERRAMGVFLGTCGGGYLNGLRYLSQTAEGGRGAPGLLLDLPLRAAASRVACEFNLNGPVGCVSNACASSAVAIAHAAELISSGRADVMIAGGFDALTPLNLVGFGMMRNSSASNRIRPFDRKRDGMLLGEGAAMLVLEASDHCERRGGTILAELLGWAVTSDTFHMTAPDPSGRGAARAMKKALDAARLEKTDISYINAHGTGTLHNDVMETIAIKRIFGCRGGAVPVSSIKSMIGHTLGAAGALELVASIVAMNGDFIPPTINYENSDPKCDLDYVPNSSRPAELDFVLSNSFGFAGTNCSLVAGHSKHLNG